MVTVNTISKYSGMSGRTVRYYPHIGLLKPWRPPENKYRVFKASDMDRLSFIRRARSPGLTLSEIYDVLAISEKGLSTSQRVRDILQLRIPENKTKIGHLMGLLARMAKKFALWQSHSNGNPDAHSIGQLIDAANEALQLPGYRPTDGAHHV